MLSDKDRMLGAVGHDLRTPLASLRVRVEQVDDDALRDKMIASIEEMAAMLTDILALARSGAGTEGREAVALRGLVEELAADYRERGKDVTVAAAADAAVMARPLLLRRRSSSTWSKRATRCGCPRCGEPATASTSWPTPPTSVHSVPRW